MSEETVSIKLTIYFEDGTDKSLVFNKNKNGEHIMFAQNLSTAFTESLYPTVKLADSEKIYVFMLEQIKYIEVIIG